MPKTRNVILNFNEPASFLSDLFQERIQHAKFTALPGHVSYFQRYTYEKISDEADHDLSKRLTKEYVVASTPVSVFYKDGTDNKVIRFCFAKKNETLETAVELLAKL